jgi:branched-chain amino acid transport system substrate-binding protein
MTALLLAGCTNRTADGPPITIGLVAALSGPYQAVGEDTRDGFLLYLDSRDGRLGGHRVNLDVVDEADQSATAVMIQSHDLGAVTGVTNSETLSRLLPTLQTNGVPLVASNGRPKLDNVNLVWSTSFLPDEPGRAMSGLLHAKVSGPVWTMGAGDEGGREDIGGFVQSFTADGGRLANVDNQPLFTTNTTNFLPYLAEASANGAKAVYASYVGADAVTFVQQYAQSDARDLPLFAPGYLTEGPVLAAQGRAAIGVQTVLNYAPDLDNPANRTFVDAWRAKHNTLPTTYAMASWDAALVLDKAISAAGLAATPAAINAAIASLGQIDSPRGSWQFSQEHAPVQKWYLRRVQTDGRTLTNSLIQDLDVLGA